MKIFSALYDWTLKWAKHKFAPYILAFLSFSESVIFPIPPDVLLAPMVLSKPEKAWRLASITTIASVIGGVCGYILGYFMFEPWIQPIINELGYQHRLEQVMEWFVQYGVWVVFIAGFSPIPYKLFTVSAGFLHMAFIPFLIASAIGRGMRFFLVAGIIRWGGVAMEEKLRKWVDKIGWAIVIIIVVVYLTFR
ncbi:YqaA family protein [Colwellia sp. UCD-KL20]|uniref:YqaA family protein n=1 Tax=Colwellia sp. UCD-KL20 TaxID=1917165 RepID=UPI000971446A|nr:YqaA family protein [Colwellia sp. UCD-KL20]